MKIYILCLLAVVLGIANADLECACPEPVHPQEDFCNKYTDWVIRARVLRAKEEREVEADSAGMKYHKMKYFVKVAQVYKGNNYIQPNTKINIYLPPNRCGFHLDVHKFYLISGTGTKAHNLKSNVCHWIARMSDLTLHQRLSLEQDRYKQSCRNCYMDKPGCAFNAGVNSECYDKYATCFRQPPFNKCVWRHGGEFWTCKNAK